MRLGVGGIGVALGGTSVGGSMVGGSVGSSIVGEGINCVGKGFQLVGVLNAFSSGTVIVLEQCVPFSSVKASLILSFFFASSSTYRRFGSAALRIKVP